MEKIKISDEELQTRVEKLIEEKHFFVAAKKGYGDDDFNYLRKKLGRVALENLTVDYNLEENCYQVFGICLNKNEFRDIINYYMQKAVKDYLNNLDPKREE